MNIIRVFPRRTKFTPTDPYSFVGDPPMWRPPAEEVHVSCTFTWDKAEAFRLRGAWMQYYPKVLVGGPAIARYRDSFTPGMYIKEDITFTSRGCNNNCPWCLVPNYEGTLREIKDFASGYIINDNNLLQCSPDHIGRVFDMLRSQRRAAIFSGGLESLLIDDSIIELLTSIRIQELFLAADTVKALDPLREVVPRLSFLERRKLRCYVMIGRDESIARAEERLKKVWKIGCLPFAQLFQPKDKWIDYSLDWKKLQWLYSRPAATKSIYIPRQDGRKIFR